MEEGRKETLWGARNDYKAVCYHFSAFFSLSVGPIIPAVPRGGGESTALWLIGRTEIVIFYKVPDTKVLSFGNFLFPE